MNLNQIGERIRTFRKAKAYTAEYLAEQLEMSTSAYYRIERNEVTIDLPTLARIVYLLDTSFANLLDENSSISPQQLDNFMNYTTNHLRKMSSNMEIMLKEVLRLKRIVEQKDELGN